MQNKNTSFNPLSLIFTLSDADLLIQELEELSREHFKVGESMHPKTFSFLQKMKLDPEKLEETDIQKLVTSLKKAKVVKIEIGFEPKVSTLRKIGQWIKTNVGDDILFSLSLNEEIIGGAAISFNGKYLCSTLIKA